MIFAPFGFLIGEYRPGRASWMASIADSATVRSFTCLRKKNSAAAPTPWVLCPKSISFRYISRISSLVNCRSIWMENHSSRSLRRMLMSDRSS